eukprot:jgi/Tetstr1/443507/TSEL_031511.t1
MSERIPGEADETGPSKMQEVEAAGDEEGERLLSDRRSSEPNSDKSVRQLKPAIRPNSKFGQEASTSRARGATPKSKARTRSIKFSAVHPEPSRSTASADILLGGTSQLSQRSIVPFAGKGEEGPSGSGRASGDAQSASLRSSHVLGSLKRAVTSVSLFFVRSGSGAVLANKAQRTTDNLVSVGFCVPRESKSSRRAINPESAALVFWDLWLVLTNVLIAIITPYQVGHYWNGVALGFEFWFNRHTDLVYTLDLLLVFNMAYCDTSSGLWVFELPKIRRKYLRGWFVFDFLTCIPYDLIMYFLWRSGQLTLGVEVLLRLLRLLRMGRLLKSTRVPQRMTWLIALDFSLLQLLKYLMYAILFAHWIACAWSLVVVLERYRQDNWVETFFGVSVMELPSFDLYVGSLYWAVMTVSTIGYGDVLPSTSLERVFVILAMLTGAFAYGYIIGAVSGIVATRDAKKNAFYSTMDGLNNFMELSKLPQTLRIKLREYFTYRCNNSVDVQGYNQLMQAMSPALRSDVAMFVNGSWIANVPHFKKCEPVFITQVALHMNYVVFPPAETIVEVGERLDHLYIVKRGIAVGRGRLFTTGKVFGEESLYKMGEASFTVRSLTFTDVTYIASNAFMELLENFPESEVQFRKASIRALFHEEVMAYCQAYNNLKEEQQEMEVFQSYTQSQELSEQRQGGEPSIRSQLSQPSFDSVLEPAPLNRATSSFLKSDAAHRRVQFYERKLRMFLMVSGLEKFKYDRSARQIQRAWRKRAARLREEEERKSKLLNTFMSDLVTGIQTTDDPPALHRASSTTEPPRQAPPAVSRTFSAGSSASPANSGNPAWESPPLRRTTSGGGLLDTGPAMPSLPPAPRPERSSTEGSTARKLEEMESIMASFRREMRMMKQAVQLTALEMTMGGEQRAERVTPFSAATSAYSGASRASGKGPPPGR